MIPVSDLRKWLDTLPVGELVGVDDGGLVLVALDTDAYIEVGGLPEYREEE